LHANALLERNTCQVSKPAHSNACSFELDEMREEKLEMSL